MKAVILNDNNKSEYADIKIPLLENINHDNYRSIIYKNYTYWYEYKIPEINDVCLATDNPDEYCNGFFNYLAKNWNHSSDIPDNEKRYVIVSTNNPNPNWPNNGIDEILNNSN